MHRPQNFLGHESDCPRVVGAYITVVTLRSEELNTLQTYATFVITSAKLSTV